MIDWTNVIAMNGLERFALAILFILGMVAIVGAMFIISTILKFVWKGIKKK